MSSTADPSCKRAAFAELFRTLRAERGLSYADLQQPTLASRGWISNVASGARWPDRSWVEPVQEHRLAAEPGGTPLTSGNRKALIHMTWRWRPHRSQPPEPLVIDSLARQPIMSVGPVTLDVAAQRVLINGWCVHLPAQEAALLGELMRQPGRAIVHSYFAVRRLERGTFASISHRPLIFQARP